MQNDSIPIDSRPLNPKHPVRAFYRRVWFRWLAGLMLVVIVLLLAVPTLLGSKWIYEPLIRHLAKDDFELTIDSVKLGWFSPFEFRGVSIRQADRGAEAATDPPLISIQTIQTNHGLLGYLINGRNIGRVEIKDAKVDIALLEDGSNLERLVRSLEDARKHDPKKTKSQPKLDLDVAIRRLSVEIATRDGSEYQVIPPMDIELSYRALNEEPMVTVMPTEILHNVELTPELVHLGLGLAIPLLAKSAWFDGRISLATKEIHIPLNAPLRSVGEATLTLHQVRSGPSEPILVGALDALAELRGKESSHELVFVDGSEVLIRVADEKVFHSGLQAGLPKLDNRLQISTQGSVGLADKSLDLKIEIPVPIEQLALRDTVQKIGVPRVTLPIGGTLDHPEIQWDVMRTDSASLFALIASRLRTESPMTSTVVDAIGGITKGQADETIASAIDFVKQLRERHAREKENEKDEIDGSEPKDAPKPERRRPFRDALKKVFGSD